MVKEIETKEKPSRSPYFRIRREVEIPKFVSNYITNFERIRKKYLNRGFWEIPDIKISKIVLSRDVGFYKTSFNYTNDDCNQSIDYSSELVGFFKVNFQLYLRNSECRKKEDFDPKQFFIGGQLVEPCQANGRAIYLWHAKEIYSYGDFVIFNNPVAAGYSEVLNQTEIVNVTFPQNEYELDYYKKSREVYARVTFKYVKKQKTNKEFTIDNGGLPADIDIDENREITTSIYFGDRYTGSEIGYIYIDYNRFVRDKFIGLSYQRISNTGVRDQFENEIDAVSEPPHYDGTTKTPLRTITTTFVRTRYDSFARAIYVFDTNSDINIVIERNIFCSAAYCEDGAYEIICPNVPKDEKGSPPPPKKMKCCSDNSDLLAEILRTVRENKKRIGAIDYPVEVPVSLINKDGKEQDSKKLESLTQFLAWYIERFDEIVGQFEIPINIEDVDLVTEGKQEVKLRLPNIAETMAEMFTMLLNLNVVNETQLNMQTRILAETGSDKQQNFKSYMAIQAIIEFLGFKTKDEINFVPFSFTPGKVVITDILKEVELPVTSIEYDDDMNLPKQMFDLLQAAAIIRAVHWRKVDTKDANATSKLANYLLNNQELIKKLTNKLDLKELEKEINKIEKEQNK